MLSPAFVQIRVALGGSDYRFSDYSAAVAETDRGLAVLKTLTAQHGLGVADLPELGSNGNVSKILNGAEGKKLTRKHMEALGRRFGVSPALFF